MSDPKPPPMSDESTAPDGAAFMNDEITLPATEGIDASASDEAPRNPVQMDAARIEALARTTLGAGLVQVVTHFPGSLAELELEPEETLQQAWRLAEEALQLAPELPDAYVLLARLVLMHEEPEALTDALELTERALTHDPDHDGAGVARATVLWRRGDPEAALDAVNRVLARGNMLPQPLVLRGLLHAQAGRAAEARRDLERAVALAPESGLLRLDAAAAADLQGDDEAAERHRRQAQALLGEAYDELAQLHSVSRE